MTLNEWRSMRQPESKWRQAARAAIAAVLDAASPELLADHKALLKAVDAAFPFGERAMLPYKQWLVERKLFRDALAGSPELPTRDEADVCMVARDLVAEGRIDEARKLVEAQAPHRLARRCPACRAYPGESCLDIDDMQVTSWPRRIHVPHHARLVGHLDAGPLFGAR